MVNAVLTPLRLDLRKMGFSKGPKPDSDIVYHAVRLFFALVRRSFPQHLAG
jgi:hypothetical protein